MTPFRTLVLVVSALGACAASAQAATPTRLVLTAPSSVALGEEILLEARLTTNGGQPVAGAGLELRQVGAVGERVMAQAVTDAEGRASLGHREYSVSALTLRVAFHGSPSYGPSRADTLVAISGVEAAPTFVMSHAPSPLVKGILFSLLGSIWLTYVYAASRVARVARDIRPGR